MGDANTTTLTLFAMRVRELIQRMNELKKENEELHAAIAASENDVRQLKEKVEQAHKDYESLKTARMLAVADGDIESAKKRLASLIREVNKCITLLSEK